MRKTLIRLTLVAAVAAALLGGNLPTGTDSPTPSNVPTARAEVPEPVVAEVIREDDPGSDCRIHGNQRCGVQVQGEWYVLDFATGTFGPRP